MKRSHTVATRPGYRVRLRDRFARFIAGTPMLAESFILFNALFVLPAAFIAVMSGAANGYVIATILTASFIGVGYVAARSLRHVAALAARNDMIPLPPYNDTVSGLLTALDAADTLQSNLRSDVIREGEDLLYALALTARDWDKLATMDTNTLTPDTNVLREHALEQIKQAQNFTEGQTRSLIEAINTAVEAERAMDTSANRNVILAAADSAANLTISNPNHQSVHLLTAYNTALTNLTAADGSTVLPTR